MLSELVFFVVGTTFIGIFTIKNCEKHHGFQNNGISILVNCACAEMLAPAALHRGICMIWVLKWISCKILELRYSSCVHAQFRKDGRVVDGTGLENRRLGNWSGGSNPSPSAIRLGLKGLAHGKPSVPRRMAP